MARGAASAGWLHYWQLPAGFQQLRPGCAVDGSIHAATPQQWWCCCVDYGVARKPGQVALLQGAGRPALQVHANIRGNAFWTLGQLAGLQSRSDAYAESL